jgi:GTPase SAR1 family protein
MYVLICIFKYRHPYHSGPIFSEEVFIGNTRTGKSSFMSSFPKGSMVQTRTSLEDYPIGDAISVALANVHTPIKSIEQEIQSQAIRGIYLYVIYVYR